MTVPILSGLILSFSMRGAYGLRWSRGPGRTLSMCFMINMRPSWAFLIASERTLTGRPWTFISICKAVIPSVVPVTLKSISPAKSSASIRSVKTYGLSPSIIRPMATPATGRFKGTPASIRARQELQVAAIEVEPFWDMISVTLRIAYGKSSSLGRTGIKARSAR